MSCCATIQPHTPPTVRGRLDKSLPRNPWLNYAIPLVVYAFFAIPIAFRQREQIHADLVCYIRRATFILHGDFYHVISDYWSPLISFCIAPLMALGMDGLYAAHAVFCVWGAVFIIAFGLFLDRFLHVGRFGRLAIGIVIALGAVRITSGQITPDVILFSLLLFYFAFIVHPRLLHRPGLPLAAGLVGGVAYLGKAYAFPFVLAHILLSFAIRGWMLWRYGDGVHAPVPVASAFRRSLAGMLITLIGFTLTAGPWVAAISWRYGHLTFGSAGKGAHLIIGPPAKAYRVYRPFYVPEGPYLIDWETPDIIHHGGWSPFQSRSLFRRQLHWIGSNAYEMCRTFASYSYDPSRLFASRKARSHAADSDEIVQNVHSPFAWNLSLLAILIAPLAALGLIQRPGQRWKTLWLLLTTLLYCSGFLFVFFAPRYIEGITLALTFLLCLVMVFFARWPTGRTPRQQTLLALAKTSLAILIIASYGAQGVHLARAARHSPRASRNLRNVAKKMQRLGLHGPFASNDRIRGYYIALHTGQKSVGFPTDGDVDQAQQKLRDAHVAALLLWHCSTLRNESNTVARHASEVAERFWMPLHHTGKYTLYAPRSSTSIASTTQPPAASQTTVDGNAERPVQRCGERAEGQTVDDP
ncbi:MAG: hypothetical protein ACM359_12590 [Bacillota bacterium]